MAEPLSIAASIAGLMTIADIVIRNGYKYITAVRDSDKAVASLINEVNSLSGTLHSLRNIAEGLEGENAPFIPTTQVHHIESCYRTLRKISELLDKFELSKTKGLLDQAKQRLRWPLTHSETKALTAEVGRQRKTLNLALNADEMSALIVLLARQDTMGATLSDIKRDLEKDRVQRKVIILDDHRKKILEWLCPTTIDHMRNQESAVSLRQPGTGVWFTDSTEFEEWKLKRNSKLWLHGIPGAGKTILMSTIIQELQKHVGDDEGFAFFYCDYKDSATQEPSSILGSLVKQFVLQKEAAFDVLAAFYQSHFYQPSSGFRSPNPESLLRLLHQITNLFSLATVLIDGLDEITRNRLDTINLLERIQSEHRKVRTLYASRREVDIEQSLRDYEHVSIAARSSDLELYVASEIDTRTRKKQLNIKDPDLKQHIMKRLIHGADGMFRWVACQIDHLCELPTDKARSKALDKLPRGLPETYERILSRVLESHEEIHDLVSRTLQWLACAAKALSGRALLEALAIVPGDTCLYLDAMTSEHEILRWCSSLVRRRVTGDGIELAHFTVKEYLLSIDLTKNPKFASFKICQEKSDLLLGQICLTYLNLDNLGKSRPPDDLFDDMRSDLESKGSEESEEYNDHDENKDDDDESSGDSGDCADIDNSRDGKLEHNTGSVTQKGGPQGASLGHEKADQLESTADVAFRPWLDKYPLLQYAANGWYSHLRVYSEDPLVVRLTHKLFDPRKSYQFLWWSYAFLCNNLGFHGETTFPDSTTLHWAALFSLHDVCSWLIEEGADVNRISSLGAPLDCALLKMAALWELDEIDCHEYMDEYHDSSLPRMQIARSTVIIVQKLIQAGARVDRTTNPNFPARPLKMALITDSHNAELISHILEGGALVDEDVLTVVEEYLDRNSDRLSTGTVPSGISALFSRVAYQDVSYATQPIYRKLSSQLAGSLSSTHETGSFSPKQLHTESDIKSLKQRFFQASEHGVYDGVESLMSSLRNLYPEDTQSTLTSGLVLALENNHKDVAHLLLSNGVNPNIADNYENSPLHRIIRDYSISDVNIVIQNIKSLVDHGADLMIKNRNGELPLHLAAKSKHEGPLKTILEVMSDESTQISLAGHDPSPLQYAVAWGADENVRLLLEKYETISPMDHRSKDGRSLMAHAATRKTAFVVRLLYQRGLTTNTVSTDGSSVLYSATSCSSEDPFNFLMDIGAIDISARRDGKKAIHEAVTNQITSTSKLAAILQAGEDPNLQMADGSTPLHLIFNEYAAIEKFQLLVNHERININCRDRKGMTPLMIYSKFLGSYQLDNKLAKRHLVQGIECLINHKADVTLADLNDDRTALHHLCLNGVTSTSFDITKLFVNSGGASLYSTDRFRITPFELLFVTCIDPTRKEKSFPQSEDFDPSDVLRFIINNASDHLNDKLSTRIPPLNFALKHGNATAVDILLEQEQVNVDIRGGDRDQLTALEIAASSGCTENIARVLLSRTDNSIYGFHPLQGYTLLHFAACDKSNQMVLRKLLERNVDIETLNRAGNTPLHIAILLENLPAVRLLLKEGANITAAVGNLDLCPLHLAASTGNLRIVESLILSGADINASSPQSGLTALHYASNRAPWSLISFLLQKGANIDARNNAGATPCLVAAQAKRWDIVRKYANTTADFNSKNFDGLGVLHYAVLSSAISIVEFLRRQGISLRQDITDHDGKVHGNTVICAAIAGNVDLFQMAWEDNAINFMNDYGWGLAHFAMCASGNGVRDLLLPYNVDWTLNTAIYYSCSKASHLRFEPKGLLPLHMAAAGGNNSAINFLNDNNLVPSMDATTGRDGHYSSLHLAVIFNRLSTVKLLKTLGADLDLKDHNEEQTALHHAAQLGFAEIVTSLLDAGCQPNPVDVNGMTPESLALENGHEAVTAVISRHLDSLETKLDSVEGEHPSASVLESSRGKQGKPWRISLAQTTHMRRVMTGNLSIYAIDDIECPEELHTMLAKNKDHGVYNLGKTFHKSIS